MVEKVGAGMLARITKRLVRRMGPVAGRPVLAAMERTLLPLRA
jgi:hypothetical protein